MRACRNAKFRARRSLGISGRCTVVLTRHVAGGTARETHSSSGHDLLPHLQRVFEPRDRALGHLERPFEGRAGITHRSRLREPVQVRSKRRDGGVNVRLRVIRPHGVEAIPVRERLVLNERIATVSISPLPARRPPLTVATARNDGTLSQRWRNRHP
jgi:hypothetical protein